jgi:hypothetical protein
MHAFSAPITSKAGRHVAFHDSGGQASAVAIHAKPRRIPIPLPWRPGAVLDSGPASSATRGDISIICTVAVK